MKRYAKAFRSATAMLHAAVLSRKTHVLVICSTREDFLKRLVLEHEEGAGDTDHDSLIGKNDVLIPSLHNLDSARLDKLIFVPTLLHLRAFLSSHGTLQKLAELAGDRSGEAPEVLTAPTLVLVEMVALHGDTPELSAQGLSRTLALLVDATESAQMDLLVVEFYATVAQEIGGSQERSNERSPWKTEVPLLNGSARRSERGQQHSVTTVRVSYILEQWLELLYT